MNILNKTAVFSVAIAGLMVCCSPAATVEWQGGEGSWADSNWLVGGVSNQTLSTTLSDRVGIGSGSVTNSGNLIAAVGGDLANQNLTVQGDAVLDIGGILDFGSGKTDTRTLGFVMTNSARVSAAYIQLKTKNLARTEIVFSGGTLVLSDSNSIRGGDFPNQNVNITAGVGEFSITANSTLAGKELSTKIGSDLFKLDGTRITVTATGSDVAVLNAELATKVVNGKYLQVSEGAGTQTLNILAAVDGLVTSVITNFPTATLAENPNSGGGFDNTAVNATAAKGQSFTVPASTSIDRFVFEMGSLAATGSFTLEIYRAMDGLPWGLNPIYSETGSLPDGLTGGGLIQIDLPAPFEVARGSYTVALRGVDDTDFSLHYSTNAVYPAGAASRETPTTNGWEPLVNPDGDLVFAVLGTQDAPLPEAPANAPNIVFIMADDLGWTDIQTGTNGPNALAGVNYGSDFYQTPNLARLAAEGLSFTHCFAHPNCAPTRAAILSGQYAPRSGNGVYVVDQLARPDNSEKPTRFVPPSQREDIPPGHIISAEVLQAGGYLTAHFGKYHVGNHEGGASTMPENQGYDFNFGGNSNGGPGAYHASGQRFGTRIGPGMDAYAKDYSAAYIDDVLAPMTNFNNPSVLVDGSKHVEDSLGDGAIAFMEDHRRGAMSARPFYLQLHNYAVHSPTDNVQARSDLLSKYAGLPDGTYHGGNSYAAIVENMDQTIGRILNYLDDPNGDGNSEDSIAANTLVIFTSDNGGYIGPTDNDPLRHHKGSFYNGGLRVPLIARQPGTIPAGVQTDALVHSVDFYPTLVESAGLAMPGGITFDGTSFAAHLQDPAVNPRDREPIFYHFPGYLDQRSRPCDVIIKRVGGVDYKLIYTYDPDYTGNPSGSEDVQEGLDPLSNPWELYRYSDDLSETNDLLNSSYSNWLLYGDIADAMAGELSAWLDQGTPDWNAKKMKDRDTNLAVGYPDSSSLPTVTPAPGAAFEVTDFSVDSGAGETTVTFNSEAGFSYQIQASTHLVSWETLQTVAASEAETIEVVVDDVDDNRFYRVVLFD